MPIRYIYFLQVHSEWDSEEELRVSSESSVDEVTHTQILIHDSITRVETILGKN